MRFLALLALSLQPQPVTPGTQDESPLAKDLRVKQNDLRQPAGFERVYELRGVDGRTVRYARINGALIALFPRSQYESGMPAIPGGTTFMIGRPEDLAADRPLPSAPSIYSAAVALDASASHVITPQSAALTASSAAERVSVRPDARDAFTDTRSIWTDENYRRMRLSEILTPDVRSRE